MQTLIVEKFNCVIHSVGIFRVIKRMVLREDGLDSTENPRLQRARPSSSAARVEASQRFPPSTVLMLVTRAPGRKTPLLKSRVQLGLGTSSRSETGFKRFGA